MVGLLLHFLCPCVYIIFTNYCFLLTYNPIVYLRYYPNVAPIFNYTTSFILTHFLINLYYFIHHSSLWISLGLLSSSPLHILPYLRFSSVSLTSSIKNTNTNINHSINSSNLMKYYALAIEAGDGKDLKTLSKFSRKMIIVPICFNLMFV